MRQIAEDARFVSRKFNETFVMMEYFGYHRRGRMILATSFGLPANQFNGNFEQADMVEASSFREYDRFQTSLPR